MMNDQDILDSFGTKLIDMVRDHTIDIFEKIKSGNLKSQEALKFSHLLAEFNKNQQEIIESLVVDFIDRTIFNFMFMFEEESDNIKIMVSDMNLYDISDGLGGQFYVWKDQFSKK